MKIYISEEAGTWMSLPYISGFNKEVEIDEKDFEMLKSGEMDINPKNGKVFKVKTMEDIISKLESKVKSLEKRVSALEGPK